VAMSLSFTQLLPLPQRVLSPCAQVRVMQRQHEADVYCLEQDTGRPDSQVHCSALLHGARGTPKSRVMRHAAARDHQSAQHEVHATTAVQPGIARDQRRLQGDCLMPASINLRQAGMPRHRTCTARCMRFAWSCGAVPTRTEARGCARSSHQFACCCHCCADATPLCDCTRA
jgi:hypothetical protein